MKSRRRGRLRRRFQRALLRRCEVSGTAYQQSQGRLAFERGKRVEDLFARDLVPVVLADVFVGDVAVFINYEYGCGREPIAEEVEDVVADGDVVVLAGVEDGEIGTGFCQDRLGAAQIVGADGEYFSAGIFDFAVVFLQLT